MFGVAGNSGFEKRTSCGGKTVEVSFVVGVEKDEVDLRAAIQAVMRSAPSARTYEVIVACPAEYTKAWAMTQKLADEFAEVTAIRCQHGQDRASFLRTGFEIARGDLILTMDIEGGDDPTAIPLILDKIDEGYDLVGCRKQRRIDAWHTKWPKRASTQAAIPNPIDASFKCYRREVGDRIHFTGSTFHVFDNMSDHEGFRVTEILVDGNEAEVAARQSTYGAAVYAMVGILAFASTCYFEMSANMEILMLVSSMGLLGIAGVLTLSGVQLGMQIEEPEMESGESHELMERPRFLNHSVRGRDPKAHTSIESDSSLNS